MRRVCLLLAMVSFNAEAADDIWVNAGFFSHHFKRAGYNEQNYGIGIQVGNITAGHYRNSHRSHSNYIAYLYQPLQVDVDTAVVKAGFSVGTMNGYPKINNNNYFPTVIPTVSIEGQRFGVNLVYMPTIGRTVEGCIAIQMKVKLN